MPVVCRFDAFHPELIVVRDIWTSLLFYIAISHENAKTTDNCQMSEITTVLLMKSVKNAIYASLIKI